MMGRMPDPTPLVYFAIFGVVCATIISASAIVWLAYHLGAALVAYIGA